MSAPVLTAMPDSFASGTTVEYSRTFASYPAVGGAWTAKLYVRGRSSLDVAATVVSGAFAFALSSAATAALLAGIHTWKEIVHDVANNKDYVAASGTVTILPNVGSAQAGDFQAFEEKMLLAIEGVLTGRITADVEHYQIGNRSLTRVPRKELWAERSRMIDKIQRNKFPGQMGPKVLATFTGVQSETGSRDVPPAAGPAL
jgi:hypothetical protein